MNIPFILTIDGRSGTGKTQLAHAIHDTLDSQGISVNTFHLDDFYRGWDGLLAGVDHMHKKILDPLLTPTHPSRESVVLEYQPWDWEHQRLGDSQTFLPYLYDVLIIEGAGATIPSHYFSSAHPLNNISIRLTGSCKWRKKRALNRDGALFAPHWNHWETQETLLYNKETTPHDKTQETPWNITIDMEKFSQEFLHQKSLGFSQLMQTLFLLAPHTFLPISTQKIQCEKFDLQPYLKDSKTTVKDIARAAFDRFYETSMEQYSTFYLDGSTKSHPHNTDKPRHSHSVMANTNGSQSLSYTTVESNHTNTNIIKYPFFTVYKNTESPHFFKNFAPFYSPCQTNPSQALINSDLPYNLGWLAALSYESSSPISSRTQATHPEETTQKKVLAHLIFPTTALIIDHDSATAFIISLDPSSDLATKIRTFLESLTTVSQPKTPKRQKPLRLAPIFEAHDSKQDYLNKISQAQEQIRDGNSYEICLTTDLQADVSYKLETSEIFELYKNYHTANPSPFSSLLSLVIPQDTYSGNHKETHYILSTSMEQFLSYNSITNTLTTTPIKGTRPRGKTPTKDQQLYTDLLKSSKDRAENIMIVDLSRNDLSRVCLPGSVTVPTMHTIQDYSTVWQASSTISGTLDPHYHLLDAVHALFPPPSMTGVPKIATLEILAELEKRPRGFYSGALGYFSLPVHNISESSATSPQYGNMELSVTIRTAIISTTSAQSHIFYGIGGAITADSIPAEEYKEIQTKADGFLNIFNSEFPQD